MREKSQSVASHTYPNQGMCPEQDLNPQPFVEMGRCSNQLMHLTRQHFEHLKQYFPNFPDHEITQCLVENVHFRTYPRAPGSEPAKEEDPFNLYFKQ